MTWFRTDDGFSRHPKYRRLPRDRRLYLRGVWHALGTYCAEQLTDGAFTADDVLDEGATLDDAAALVSVGLWHAHGHDCNRCPQPPEDGFQFHDWRVYNPLREQVLAERQVSSRRQALVRDPALREAVRRRDADVCRYCARAVRWADRRGDLGGTYDHVDPLGGNTFENLVVCCRGCNARKSNRTPEQARMVLLPPPDLEHDQGQDSRSDLDTDLGLPVRNLGGDLGRSSPRPVPSRPSGSHLSSSGHQSDARENGPTDDDLARWAQDAPPGVDLTVERQAFRTINAGRWDEIRNPQRAWVAWLAEAARRQATADRPTPTPSTPECPVHPGRPTGSKTCPECSAERAPEPDVEGLRAAVRGGAR